MILISNDISQDLAPGAMLKLSLHLHVWTSNGIDNRGEVIVEDGLDYFTNIRVFLLGKVAFLNLVEQFLTSCFGNEKRLCGPATLKSDFSRILKITNKQVLLNDALSTFIPVDILRNRFLNSVHARTSISGEIGWTSRLLILRSTHAARWSTVLARLVDLLVLLAQLTKEVSSIFCRHHW